MKLNIYQVDAFAETVFSGNPAAVVPLGNWLPDEIMQNIALENNLSETAFFVPSGTGFHLRWFTPAAEVKLCGHATLASAHVIFNHLNYSENEILFDSLSGKLSVKKENGLYVLNFPASKLEEAEYPENLKDAFNFQPVRCIRGRDDLLLVFRNEKEIREIQPDLQKILSSKTRGIIVTAPSETFDFVSRFFAPAVGVNEDPVTGSAHTMLIPFWSRELKKDSLVAKQISARGGILYCRNLTDRVEIGGHAVTFMTGEISI